MSKLRDIFTEKFFVEIALILFVWTVLTGLVHRGKPIVVGHLSIYIWSFKMGFWGFGAVTAVPSEPSTLPCTMLYLQVQHPGPYWSL